MMRLRACLLLVLCLSAPIVLLAEECQDSPLLSRLNGCKINNCEKKAFDAADLTLLPWPPGRVTKHLEGKVEKIDYNCNGVSGLQIGRNTEQALRSAGYHIDLTTAWPSGPDRKHYVTGHKGPQWISVEARDSGSGYEFVSVLVQEMAQEMTSNADVWANEINKTGHVAVYGIEFDTAKASLKPESENVLNDVLKLLNNQSGWKMKIEGHTDSTGTKAGNQVLSQQRAGAVVDWLVGKGIARTRLVAAGLGDSRPVADNSTDQGRARNRRVELVKQ
jgi:outer membrane protein OmpA-like peptidoglycan-associated protein